MQAILFYKNILLPEAVKTEPIWGCNLHQNQRVFPGSGKGTGETRQSKFLNVLMLGKGDIKIHDLLY